MIEDEAQSTFENMVSVFEGVNELLIEASEFIRLAFLDDSLFMIPSVSPEKSGFWLPNRELRSSLLLWLSSLSPAMQRIL